MTARKHIQAKISALRSGELPRLDLRAEMADQRPGEVPGPDFRAVLQLAVALQESEEPGSPSVSWERQVRAEGFFNAHGLAATLDEIQRLT